MSFAFRVGLGFDVHRLEAGIPFWLGGVLIDFEKGAKGHSDADVMIHAICDALLGAANLGDIGLHFPDTDPAFKGIDSKILLAKVCELIKLKNYLIGNLDVMLCLEKPKIKPYIARMQQCLAEVMEIEQQQLSIKATTNEQMGYVGREEGVYCQAIALIYKKI